MEKDTALATPEWLEEIGFNQQIWYYRGMTIATGEWLVYTESGCMVAICLAHRSDDYPLLINPTRDQVTRLVTLLTAD